MGQGAPERHHLPDWEKWHLGSTDRGVVLNREVWRQQVERVEQGLDPIGVTRNPEDDRIVRITADDIHDLTWEEGMRLFDMSVEERLELIARQAEGALTVARH